MVFLRYYFFENIIFIYSFPAFFLNIPPVFITPIITPIFLLRNMTPHVLYIRGTIKFKNISFTPTNI